MGAALAAQSPGTHPPPKSVVFGGCARRMLAEIKLTQVVHMTPAEKIQKQLDEALEDSFPASDPVSIVTSQQEEDWVEETKAPSAPGSSPPG